MRHPGHGLSRARRKPAGDCNSFLRCSLWLLYVAGGASPEAIGDHFCNELSKREIGRRRCLAGECHVFMSIDADEFYARGQLAEAIRAMWQGGHDVVTCRMRHFMVDPTWELRPHDDTNRVAAVMRCHTHMPFRLCVPTSMLIDPTRRLLRASRILDLPRARLEMHHMSLVRRNLKSKFSSVSNRANYPQGVSGRRPVVLLIVWGMPDGLSSRGLAEGSASSASVPTRTRSCRDLVSPARRQQQPLGPWRHGPLTRAL